SGPFSPVDPQKAELRDTFQTVVGSVAFVKTENGIKCVCLTKKGQGDGACSGTGTGDTGVSRHPPRAADGRDVAPPPGEARQVPGSGYGNGGSPRTGPRGSTDGSARHEFVCVGAEVTRTTGEMGNRGSVRREKKESEKEKQEEGGGGGRAADIPQITVIEASPLPEDRTVFNLTHTAHAHGPHGPPGLQVLADTQPCSPQEAPPPDCDEDNKDKGDGRSDSRSLSGSEGSATPKASRRHFLQAMIDSSPQVRRSVAMRGSVYLSSKSDSDSASVASSNPDEDDDPAPVTLDPLEHEWMLCASDGEWASLSRLLAAEPALLLKKDFVTGFTCLHWAAKHGKPKLIALVVNFAKRHGVPISVDVRSNAGYTPLHVAAMHNHTEVVKLLVGAYDANVEIRDYSGKKACQYLSEQAGVDIRDIVGQYELSDAQNTDRQDGGRREAQSADCQDGGRWRFSRVLQSNLKPLRLLNNDGGDEADGEGRQQEKPLRRKSSLSGMKPRLQRLRMRTSQIVHSVTFHDTEELEKCGRGSWRSRPKTHFFG
ncbi:ankyrin repeat domain-containing protein SOWAHC-like, partial [Sphaeramia orbicularis]|uniref:ankyrin repeat domain-containing protein SOWAHC-like n=1 Tax=Sphaeramia orbicularis TaxID=375764 RepID=UPI00117F5E53